MLRTIGGVIAGVVVFAATLALIEYLAHQIAPARSDGLLLGIVAFAYFLAPFLGGLTAAKISREGWTVWLVTGLALAGGLWAVMSMAQPLWMQIASIAAPLLGGFAAWRMAGRRGTGTVA